MKEIVSEIDSIKFSWVRASFRKSCKSRKIWNHRKHRQAASIQYAETCAALKNWNVNSIDIEESAVHDPKAAGSIEDASIEADNIKGGYIESAIVETANNIANA